MSGCEKVLEIKELVPRTCSVPSSLLCLMLSLPISLIFMPFVVYYGVVF
jgi:hypothetical protein